VYVRRFTPTQCYPRRSEKFPECWCVDEAGNQLPNTVTFKRGAKICREQLPPFVFITFDGLYVQGDGCP
jgi:hypothetical protein